MLLGISLYSLFYSLCTLIFHLLCSRVWCSYSKGEKKKLKNIVILENCKSLPFTSWHFSVWLDIILSLHFVWIHPGISLLLALIKSSYQASSSSSSILLIFWKKYQKYSSTHTQFSWYTLLTLDELFMFPCFWGFRLYLIHNRTLLLFLGQPAPVTLCSKGQRGVHAEIPAGLTQCSSWHNLKHVVVTALSSVLRQMKYRFEIFPPDVSVSSDSLHPQSSALGFRHQHSQSYKNPHQKQ